MNRSAAHNQEFWDYTSQIRLQHGDTYAERPLIGRDTPIDGGVYYGKYEGEATVVDSQKYPQEFDEWYSLARKRASVNDTVERSFVLDAVYHTVLEQMPYSQKGVDRTLATVPAFENGTKVTLNSFMDHHVGVCRHQALVAATLLEKFKSDGVLHGHVSIDRSEASPRGEREGHAWVRYTNSNGRVYIIDVANEFIGTLQEANASGEWNYARPEEKATARVHRIGRHAAFRG